MLPKRIFRRLKRTIQNFFYSEEELYYKELFIHNPRWNSVSINDDQILRWNAVKNFMDKIRISSKEISILDAGCGNGWLTNLLVEYGKVTGVEPVTAVVKYGKKMYPKLRLLASDLPTFIRNHPSEKFDVIVSSEVIEHIPDGRKGEFVTNMHALLNAGGHVIITTPRKEILSELGSDPNQPVEDWLTENEVRHLYEERHFKALDCQRLIPADPGKLEVYQAWLFKSL
jgi:2-polyprenyl-3-methyl-5-hydroxy-6-metoxy-1,4-benzoquinol methylase